MFMMGVFGEYLWRTFDEARGRPRYVIEEHLCSLEDQPAESGGQERRLTHPPAAPRNNPLPAAGRNGVGRAETNNGK
jgi:hypothetical protein